MRRSKLFLAGLLALAGWDVAQAQNAATQALLPFTVGDTQRELARAIGTLCLPGNRLTPRLQNDCNNLVGGAFAGGGGVRQAISSIVGDNVTATVDSSMVGRFGTSRPPALYSGSAFAVLTTDNEALMTLNLAGDELGGSGWSAFFNARFDGDEREVSLNEDGFDRDGQSLILGLDRRVSNSLAFGVALGFGRGDLEFTGNSGTLDTDELGVNLYVNWQGESGIYLDSLLGFNSRENDQVRVVRYGVATNQVDQRYDAQFDSSDRLLALTVGYRFNNGSWNFDPYGRFELVDAESDGYSEFSRTPDSNGAGWALDVAKQDENFTRAAIGFRGSYAMSAQNGVYQPFFDIAWIHTAGVDENAASVRFRGDASTGVNLSPVDFFMIADGEDQSYGVFSLGISAQWQNGWSGFVGYRGNFGEDRYTHHELNGGLRMEF